MTRQEAISKLRKWDFLDSEEKEVIETLIPELKESEDEGVRKSLIDFLKSPFVNENITDEKVAPWISWLEKQGEQPNKVSIWKHWKDGIAGNGEGKTIFLVKNGNNYSFSSCLGCECDYIELSELDKLMVEKQGEQKPAWSEEDEKMWITISDLLWEGFKLSDGKVSWDKIRCWLLPKITYFKDRVQTHSKQEWSEEDERIKYNLIKYCGLCRSMSCCGRVRVDEAIAWLKSLKERYTWKPSDEQMKQLGWIAEQNKDNMIGKELMSLYQELKKLKGE